MRAHLVGMESSPHAIDDLEPMLSIDQLADYLGLPVRTLYDWRQSQRGPQAIHVGRQLRYFVSDVRRWLEEQRESVTGEARGLSDGR